MNIQKKKKKKKREKTVRSSKVKNVTQFKQSVNEPESSPKSFFPLEDRLLDFYFSLNCLVEILYRKYVLANPAFQMY